MMVGGSLTPEDRKSKCVDGQYAAQVTATEMQSSKHKGKAASSGQHWKRPDFFDIYILTNAGQ